MNSSPPAARFKCKHCGVMFSKRSNWTRHESNLNVHSKPPRRKAGIPAAAGEQSESSTTDISPVRVRPPPKEPEGLSTRRRSRAAEAERKRHRSNTFEGPSPTHEAPTASVSIDALKITIRPHRSKRPRLSFTDGGQKDDKPVVREGGNETEPTLIRRRRPPNLDARNACFKRWIRVMRHTKYVPGETAPGTPNPLPRQLVRQRAREYAAMTIEPGSSLPGLIDPMYDINWVEIFQAFGCSNDQNDEAVTIEDLGESSTDSDSSLWDSD